MNKFQRTGLMTVLITGFILNWMPFEAYYWTSNLITFGWMIVGCLMFVLSKED